MSRLLIPHLVRAISWWPLAAAVPLALLAQLPALGDEPSELAVLSGLWLAAGVLGAGAAFALPDAMASTVITPVPRWTRQWLRLGLATVPACLLWALIHLGVRSAAEPATSGFVVLQAAVCGLLPIAAAAIGTRHRHTATAALAGPATQGIVLAGTLFLTDRASPWTLPAGEWTAAQQAWPVAFGLLLAVLLVAGRDTSALPFAGRPGPRRIKPN